MQIVKVKISLIEGNIARIHGSDLFRYIAEVIRNDKGEFYYRVDGVEIKITLYEAKMVIRNPHLYYFSTALWLHLQIQRKGGLLLK